MAINKRTFTASHLALGQAYRVTLPFTDYDGIVHPAGEHWRFVSKSFLPYEDGLTLFVEENGKQRSYRLQWRPEAQAQIVDNFSDYVEEV